MQIRRNSSAASPFWGPSTLTRPPPHPVSGLTPCLSTLLPRYLIEWVCISSQLFSCSQRFRRACQCGLQRWASLSLRHPHSTSRDFHTFLLCRSNTEPSVFDRSPLRCTSRKASSFTGASLTHVLIRSFLYPFFVFELHFYFCSACFRLMRYHSLPPVWYGVFF